MVIKCPHCDGALEYNVEHGMMYCMFCDAYFTAEQISISPGNHTANTVNDTVAEPSVSTQQPAPEEPAPQDTQSKYIWKPQVWDDEKTIHTDSYGRNAGNNYDIPAGERAQNVMDYYAEQRRLSEEYNRRKEQGIDYTKSFAGTTFEGMSPEERKAEKERQRQEVIDRNEKAFFGSPEEDKGFHNPFGYNNDLNAGEFNRARPKHNVMNGKRVIHCVNCMLTTDEPEGDGEAMLDNQVYTCKSCGAELCISGVETSSFCIYCGQPTIVFDRMEKTRMPDSIIPFNVTRDQALKLIREKINKGIFVPAEVKNFEPERLCGIYIPYWLFDAYYYDNMVIRSRVKSGKTTVTKYYRRCPSCHLYYFPVDASKNLNDYSSQKLEPYDYSGMRPFNAAYMSGFYSDRFDMSADQMMATSMYRAQMKMYDYVKTTVPGSPQGLTDSYPQFHVSKKYYTMLPAWFMTFRHNNQPYTIMVNGQTGKVVGAVPYSKKKFFGLFGAIFTGMCVLNIPIGIFFSRMAFYSSGKDSSKPLFYALIGCVVLFIFASRNFNKYKKSMDLTTEEKMTKFVKGRQET